MNEVLHGIGVGPGRVAGPVLAMGPPPVLPVEVPGTDSDLETTRAVQALAEVDAGLRARAEVARTPEGHDVLLAQAELVSDPMLRDDILERVRQGHDAPHAVAAAFAAQRAVFAEMGGFLAERVADLDDLTHRTLAVLLDAPMPGVPEPGYPFILVADDLAPADTATLDPATVLALVTERGGPTSHTAIIARALGLPAVVGCPGAARLTGLAIVDGTAGEVRPDVTAAEAAAVPALVVADRGEGPGRTADGHPVPLLANIGSAADLDGVDPVEGIGLFRTEFLFLDRATAPSLAEQIDAYAKVFAAMADRPVVVRTLDAGADKPLPFLSQGPEPNPALGVRGLRTARFHPDILTTQLRAIAQAAAGSAAEVRVMAPMVATAAETAAFVAQCHAHGLATAGVMVEIPAAALRADRLLESASFLSIGTNDLAQYALAVDRQCGDLPELLDPWQPALLDLVAMCARAGAAAGKPVGICGEAAADPLLAPVLVGLGVTSLSMAPVGLPAVRSALAAHTLAECRDLAAAALAADDGGTAREAVRARVHAS
jgi:phosphotransferase system enzyme I (PtsI)